MRKIASPLGLALLFTALAPVGAQVGTWQPLAQQLKSDGVKPGSALAALIAANQDFALLRPAEARDGIPLPPWLRVLWRKRHPEYRYVPGDPTGGYPLVLREAHEWMVHHQDLQPGANPPPAAPTRTASADADRRISGVQNEPRSESSIRIDPWHPNRIVSSSNNILFGGAQAQYHSLDGGASWGQSYLPLQPGDAFQSDPAVDWTSDGTAWTLTLGIDGFVSRLFLYAYKSTDGGATWTFDGIAAPGHTVVDKDMMWVDHSETSAFKDNVYGIWDDTFNAFVSRRTPLGGWQTPIQVSGAETTGTAIGGDVTTNQAGELFATWPDTGSQTIWTARSGNGGLSFSAPVKVASTFGSFQIGIPADDFRGVLIYVSTGAYKSPTHDNVYVTWTDLSGETGCQSPFDQPGFDPSSACKTRIWFARSTNGGVTWNPPVMLNNQPSHTDQFFSWLAVDPTTGAVGVTYYDTVDSASRLATDVWYQSSVDGGATWSAPLKITSSPTDETQFTADTGNQYGDYTGLSGYAGLFFPSWTDRRYDKAEEIWTAAIHDVACSPLGAPQAGAATVPGANQIQVSWGNGAPASARFNVYRATGTCAAHGSFGPIAGGVAGASFLDTTVSGTLQYAYQIRGIDANGNCESAPSGCLEATATGACTAPPSFAGVSQADAPPAATCTATVSWSPGQAACGGPVSYNVYRSTAPDFQPALQNRVATGLQTTSFTDTGALVDSRDYFYVVRAVDGANGVEDGNTLELRATPNGAAVFADTFEGSASGGGFDHAGWSHSAVLGGVDWTPSTSQAKSPTHSWFSAEQDAVSDRLLVAPPLPVQAGSTLHFWHTYAFEGDPFTCYDAGVLEGSIDGGTSWNPLPFFDFLAGGPNGFVNPGYGNPLGGEVGWCGGTIGALSEVVADLSSFAGNTLRLRWHEGDDNSNSIGGGWYVDSVSLVSPCQPPPPPPLGFFIVSPCRLADTRLANGPSGGPALLPGADRAFPVAGLCGVPAGARAVAINVTITQAAAPGDLRLYSANQPPPLASTLNYRPGQTRSNNAVVSLASDGSGLLGVHCDSSGPVHVIVDVAGYFQ